MPKVGNKHYAYTAAGIAKAKNAAKKMGTKLKMHMGGHIGNLGFTTVNNLKKKLNGKKTAQLKTKGLEGANPIIKLADEQRRKRLMQSLQEEHAKSTKDRNRRR
tara:strand:- start:69 stop:380 length:312 start_codon:yes stop_codon:yes gene_type:complete